MTTIPLRSRYRGALLGPTAGDARTAIARAADSSRTTHGANGLYAAGGVAP